MALKQFPWLGVDDGVNLELSFESAFAGDKHQARVQHVGKIRRHPSLGTLSSLRPNASSLNGIVPRVCRAGVRLMTSLPSSAASPESAASRRLGPSCVVDGTLANSTLGKSVAAVGVDRHLRNPSSSRRTSYMAVSLSAYSTIIIHLKYPACLSSPPSPHSSKASFVASLMRRPC